MQKPIKRHVALEPVSREHHFGLLLSWKICEGLRRNIELARIKSYVDWFWKNQLKQHFEFEEEYIFPVLDNDNVLLKQVLQEHEQLVQLFTATDRLEQNLSTIEEKLVEHIRFEERIVFEEIQKRASEEQLVMIEKNHSKQIVDEWKDEFWTDADKN